MTTVLVVYRPTFNSRPCAGQRRADNVPNNAELDIFIDDNPGSQSPICRVRPKQMSKRFNGKCGNGLSHRHVAITRTRDFLQLRCALMALNRSPRRRALGDRTATIRKICPVANGNIRSESGNQALKVLHLVAGRGDVNSSSLRNVRSLYVWR